MTSTAPAYQVPFIIGIVGHRDLVPEQVPAIRAALERLLADVRTRFPAVPVQVLTSLADGADLLGAEVAHEMGLKVIALLPFGAARCREDLTSEPARVRFDAIMSRAECLELPSEGGEAAANDSLSDAVRDRQFQRAGVLIARYSALLVAIWDGFDTEHVAGTARVIEYRRRGVTQSGDADLAPRDALLSAGDNDWIFDIRCARVGRPAAEQDVKVLGFVSSGSHQPQWPRALEALLSTTAAFNRDVEEHAAAIARSSANLLPDARRDWRAGAAIESLEYLDRLFVAADWLGVQFRRAYARALRLRYGLWALMACLLLAFKKQNEGALGLGIILAALGVFGIGALLAFLAHRRQWQRKYLDYRALAEGLRVEFYWEIAGVRSHFGGEFAHEGFLQRQDVHLEWIRSAMRSVSLRLALMPGAAVHGGLTYALETWIGAPAPGGSAGQLQYYAARGRSLAQRLRVSERINQVCLVVGLALAGAFAIDIALRGSGGALLSEAVRGAALWALALLTVFVAIFEVYVAEKADRALVRQYRYMQSLFGVAANELQAARSAPERLRILHSLGYACLAEHAQWILAHRDKRIEGLRW
jgi:hypothetical protein